MIRRNLLLPDVDRWSGDGPLIELRDVSKRFGDLQVLSGLSLTVEAGKTTVIAGESGSGKSVLLRMMNGLTLPDTGSVLLFGRDLAAVSERERTELRKRCTMVFQSYALIDSMSVFDNVAFPLVQNTRMPRDEIARLVSDLLEMLELANAIHLMPAALSGGMKKRVALARAVITNPEVVLFDEPTTGLDPIMIDFVDQMILRTQREFDLTSVVISHDMASNQRLADTMCVLAEGRIVETGDFTAVCDSDHPAVRAFMAHVVTERGAGATLAEASPDLEATPVVARVSGLHKSFGDLHVLKGIDLEIPARRITVVIGGSGSGKSVLIKHIIGLLRPDEGRVEVFGEDLAALDTKGMARLRARIGMLFQGAALFDSMTVRENLAFPLVEGRGQRGKAVRAAVDEIAERLQVQGILDRLPAKISNGERKRVGLARALITKPEIMIYDEPTTGQDPVMMKRVDDMIVEASESFDITSIVISHDMVSTFRIADQVAMVYEGRLAAVGSPATLQASTDDRVRAFIYAGT